MNYVSEIAAVPQSETLLLQSGRQQVAPSGGRAKIDASIILARCFETGPIDIIKKFTYCQ